MKYKIEEEKIKKKCKKMTLKLELAKWMNGLFNFSNVCSIYELMLCNQNLPKLLYPSLLSSTCRAWALKLEKKNDKIN